MVVVTLGMAGSLDIAGLSVIKNDDLSIRWLRQPHRASRSGTPLSGLTPPPISSCRSLRSRHPEIVAPGVNLPSASPRLKRGCPSGREIASAISLFAPGDTHSRPGKKQKRPIDSAQNLSPAMGLASRFRWRIIDQTR